MQITEQWSFPYLSRFRYLLNFALCSYFSTYVVIIRVSSYPEPNSGITAITTVFVVNNETNSCSGAAITATHGVEAILVTVALQGGLWANQRLLRVTTQWLRRSISHQRSVSTESWRVCWLQWISSGRRSSYQDRSWRMVCPNRSAAWSLVNQAQSDFLVG